MGVAMKTPGTISAREDGRMKFPWTAAALMLAASQFAWTAASAQVDAPRRYPWDARPAACDQAAATPPAECRIDHWPAAEVARERLDMLASMRDFALVERGLSELLASDRNFPDGTSTASAVLGFIGERVDQHKAWPPGGRHPSPLATWQTQFPQSNFVAIAQALQLPQGKAEQKLASVSPGPREMALWQLAHGKVRGGAPTAPRLARSELYPWDQRPAKCAMPQAQGSPMCAMDHWPTATVAKERLALLRERGQWVLLERALADLSASERLFPDGGGPGRLIHSTLVSFADDGRTRARTGPPLAEWRAAVPDSAFLQLIDAAQLQRQAREARGEGYASTVSRESWEIFREKHQAARDTLLAAPASIRATAAWHYLMLRTDLDLGGVKEAASTYTAAASRWPREIDFHSQVAGHLQPKWGGKWELLEDFVVHVNQSLEAQEGDATYARLHVDIEVANGEAAPTMQWERMKQGFEDWITRYPHPWPRNLYASHACRAGDKAAFARALRLLPREAMRRTYWLKKYPQEACYRGAGV